MADYHKGFNFDQGSLGRNLALMDERIHDHLDRDLDAHAVQAELTMKAKAPWTDNTGSARMELWATAHKGHDTKSITLGHGVPYGVYLEKSNGGRFQIIMPVLVETARSYMRSLEQFFAQLETHTTPVAQIAPGVGTRPGTSQGATERAQHVKGEARSRARQVEHAVRQTSRRIFSGITRRTKRTRRG